MKIGVDITFSKVCGVLVCKDMVLATVTLSIYDIKRDSKKEITDKILNIIDSLFTSEVEAIGLSLPTKLSPDKGVLYDLDKIPHWKNIRIKTIIEEKFRVPTFINSDVNCFILGEKKYGSCKNYKDIICVTIDTTIGTSAIVNDKLFTEGQTSFTDVGCLSSASYKCVRNYHDSYVRTMEELLYLSAMAGKEIEYLNLEVWKELNVIVGRLIAILLSNFNPQVILLGGELAASYNYCVDSIKSYTDMFKPSYIKGDKLMIIPAEVEDARAIGACYLSA